MMVRRLVLPLVLISCTARGTAAEPGPNVFQKLVQPLLRDHCVRCHGPAKQEARLQLHKLSGAVAEDGVQTWETILDQLQAGAMPPKTAKQPAASDLKLAVAWIQNELRAAAQAESLIARVYPAQGNRLDHDLLFKVGADATAAAPLRIWRVNTEIYKAAIARIARKDFQDRKGKFNFAPPWGFTSEEGFKDYAALYRIDEPETELLLGNAQQAARAMLNKTGRFAAESRPYQTYLAAAAADDALVRATVQAAFRQVLQREPTDDERQRYAKLLSEGGAEFGRDKGLELMLSAVLLHPDLVFRFELGDGKTDALGRSMLAPRELADALAFALTDLGPDAELLQAVRDGKLLTRSDAARHAQRLLDDPKVEKPRILRFFQEYFGYTEAVEVFKDDATRKAAGLGHRHYRPNFFVDDTNDLVLYVLGRDQNVLAELLTTRKSFVVGKHWRSRTGGARSLPHPFSKDEKSNLHYNIAPEDWSEHMPFDLPEGQRSGVLTQPSWLIAHSTNFENEAIQRGKWIREHLLGGTIPDTPITVDAKLPEDPHKTLRERMSVTREAFCWKCHQQMDPLGFTFEMYDHFGRFRTTEVMKPVDARGAITGSGDAQLDGPVKDAPDLLRKLAASERVEQVFVRHAFRYWMGRNETLADAKTLQDAHHAYKKNGGSMKALIAALLTSDSFLYRQAPRSACK